MLLEHMIHFNKEEDDELPHDAPVVVGIHSKDLQRRLPFFLFDGDKLSVKAEIPTDP